MIKYVRQLCSHTLLMQYRIGCDDLKILQPGNGEREREKEREPETWLKVTEFTYTSSYLIRCDRSSDVTTLT